ncbi:hypothetical protein FA370_20765 [Pseudomonas aeruginosa]|nr:hypothetical protein [Pseudomonas aeruginosa]
MGLLDSILGSALGGSEGQGGARDPKVALLIGLVTMLMSRQGGARTALARHQHGHQPDQQGHFRIASTSLSFRATQRRTENRIEQSHWSSS